MINECPGKSHANPAFALKTLCLNRQIIKSPYKMVIVTETRQVFIVYR